MTDPQVRFEVLDPGRIDVQSHEELYYWTRELHCAEAQLLEAVSRVGNHVTAVREYLDSQRGAPTHRRGASEPPGAA